MAYSNHLGHIPAIRQLPRWLVQGGYGFLYWLAFLLVLEPGNVYRTHAAGHTLDMGAEMLRMAVAALLGASVTPLVLALVRRFPLLGAGRWRHALVHSAGAGGLAFGLIVTSCFLVAWEQDGTWLPSVADLRAELIGNWLLLIYALLALTAIAHVVQHFRVVAESSTTRPMPIPLDRIPVKTRGRQGFVELTAIDWVESQGNYVALHAGATVHLVRESLGAFEARLDPQRFVRIHRGIIVAVDRIRDLQPITNGDAMVRLHEGQHLRASRRYRRLIAERWGAGRSSAD